MTSQKGPGACTESVVPMLASGSLMSAAAAPAHTLLMRTSSSPVTVYRPGPGQLTETKASEPGGAVNEYVAVVVPRSDNSGLGPTAGPCLSLRSFIGSVGAAATAGVPGVDAPLELGATLVAPTEARAGPLPVAGVGLVEHAAVEATRTATRTERYPPRRDRPRSGRDEGTAAPVGPAGAAVMMCVWTTETTQEWVNSMALVLPTIVPVLSVRRVHGAMRVFFV